MSKVQWEYDLVERPFCDLLEPADVYRVVSYRRRVYFGMCVSPRVPRGIRQSGSQ